MQALYAMALEPIAEVRADKHSYGFRKRRGVHDAIEQCFVVLAQRDRAKWVLEGDIRACFDQINHQWMLDNIPMDRSILQKWLKAGFIEAKVFHETSRGTPQGGVISPILANMALDGLQEMIAKSVPRRAYVNFVRYADDFICTAKDAQILEDIVKPTVMDFMGERGLELSKEKTFVTHIDRGFDFLGYNIRKFNETLLIQPQKEKIKQFRLKLKGCIRALRYEPAHRVIFYLNRMMTGWAMAYRNSCASKTFSSIDHYVFQTIWRELRRRHPQKSAKWIEKTYFMSGSRNWTFFGVECKGDRRRLHTLQFLGQQRIRRHVKTMAEAVFYDRDWKEYFKAREGKKMSNRIIDRLTGPKTIGKWQKYPKNQLELFETGLREQP